MTDRQDNQALPRTLALPEDLRAAVERALAAVPNARWTRAAQALSERYRAPRSGAEPPLATGAADALGYVALVLPAAYAQLRGAMAATAARIPSWAPETMLDLGSGPGTALWAAAAQWPTLRHMVAWEREPAFIALGRDLAARSESAAVRAAHWERVDLLSVARSTLNVQRRVRFDLVVLGHVLNELPAERRAGVVEAAWRRTAGLLLIVEPGTPAVFPVVRASRAALLAEGARTIAPCAHDAPCPLEGDWCHFPQRIWRPEFQRRARGAPSPWEESKFSYAALARFGPERPIWGRVIREPTSNKAYAEATISAREGIVRYRALKRHREAYRRTQDLTWGEALEELLA
ncbi:MAG TPA: small ribosomal subunit Rsm22 family protein [Roseiflexaceae bacterium]|nr:small ribosomal subunit Rsm22 family protein [Roseiflexaceae bacterium]